MPLQAPLVTIAGNLVADPTLKETKGGKKVVNIRLACTPSRFNAQTGWRNKETIFVTATAWDAIAENICTSLKKGNRVIVHGEIKPTSWISKGEKRTGWEIDITEIGASLTYATTTIHRQSSDPGSDLKDSDTQLDSFLPRSDQWASAHRDDSDPFPQ